MSSYLGRCPKTGQKVHVRQFFLTGRYQIVREDNLHIGFHNKKWYWGKYGDLFDSINKATEAFRIYTRKPPIHWRKEGF